MPAGLTVLNFALGSRRESTGCAGCLNLRVRGGVPSKTSFIPATPKLKDALGLNLAFDDAVGEVSGTWVLGRKAAIDPGLLIYIMVDSVASTLNAVISHGGAIVQPVGMDAPEITARISDPAGNVIGLYQQRRESGPGHPSTSAR